MDTMIKFVGMSAFLQTGIYKVTNDKYATFSLMGCIYALSQLGMSEIFKKIPSAAEDWTLLYLFYFLYEAGMAISYKKYFPKNEHNFFLFHHAILITFIFYWRNRLKNIGWKESRWFFIWNSSAFTSYAMSLFTHYYPHRDKFYFKVRLNLFLLQRFWRAAATYCCITDPAATRKSLINGLLPGFLMEVIDVTVTIKSMHKLYNRVHK